MTGQVQVVTLSGVVTEEECPICGEISRVEHGWLASIGDDEIIEYYERQREIWYCPECGERDIICRDCPHCTPVEQAA